MKRLVIIVEGDTEKEFVDKILTPYLYSQGLVDVSCFKIKHTRGGLTKYQHLKTDLINCIYENDVIISTLVDYYALPKDFPKYNDSLSIVNKEERLNFLEQAIVEDINQEQNSDFQNLVPYIQLHEFEALVFSSMNGVKALYEPDEVDLPNLINIIDDHPNPEDINDNPSTAPSKRLKSLIKGYNKVIHGTLIIEENGIDTVLQKCTRFSEWVEKLIVKTTV